LGMKDIIHLSKLAYAITPLGSKNQYPVKVYTQKSGYAAGKEYAKLLITSSKMCNYLIKHGVTHNKTHTLEFPKLDHNLVRHYIRGYFDGDGSWAKSKKSASGFTMKICGNESFLRSVAEHLKLPPTMVRPHKNIYSLEKSGKGVLAIMNYMYEDSTICLERKKEKWYIAQSLLAEKLVE
jgi:intein-encoded DNA endonuclease-like protein